MVIPSKKLKLEAPIHRNSTLQFGQSKKENPSYDRKNTHTNKSSAFFKQSTAKGPSPPDKGRPIDRLNTFVRQDSKVRFARLGTFAKLNKCKNPDEKISEAEEEKFSLGESSDGDNQSQKTVATPVNGKTESPKKSSGFKKQATIVKDTDAPPGGISPFGQMGSFIKQESKVKFGRQSTISKGPDGKIALFDEEIPEIIEQKFSLWETSEKDKSETPEHPATLALSTWARRGIPAEKKIATRTPHPQKTSLRTPQRAKTEFPKRIRPSSLLSPASITSAKIKTLYCCQC